MKYTFFLLFSFASFFVKAQGVDSTQIPQTITLPQKYQVYVLGFNKGAWGTVDYFNYINQVRAQMDSVNAEKPIRVTVSSGLIRDLFQSMSYQPEGQATQYNENIQTLLGSQITNPWLGSAIYQIRQQNWNARDEKIKATEKELFKINTP